MECREGRNGRGVGEVIWGLELMICLSYIESFSMGPDIVYTGFWAKEYSNSYTDIPPTMKFFL